MVARTLGMRVLNYIDAKHTLLLFLFFLSLRVIVGLLLLHNFKIFPTRPGKHVVRCSVHAHGEVLHALALQPLLSYFGEMQAHTFTALIFFFTRVTWALS